MKTLGYRGRLYAIVWALAFIVVGVANGHAQQALELTVPSRQVSSPSPVYHRAAPTPNATPAPSPARVQTIPQAQLPTPPPPPPPPVTYRPAPQATPPAPELPSIFRGCWQGEVDQVDSIERLPGGARLGPWTAKTYRLCYRRSGNGPFHLTFTQAGIANSSRIINAQGTMQVIATDGRTYATMRALLHFDEYRMSGGTTFPVDEITQLSCDIQPDGMHVTGSVYGEHGGKPWFRASWGATFMHTADTPSVPE